MSDARVHPQPMRSEPRDNNLLQHELLQQFDWVRQLATQLVGADGDDLAHDTMVAALQRPPAYRRVGAAGSSHGSSENTSTIRGWLATVMRRRASNMRRGEFRRDRRQRAAAQKESVADDTARSLVELETQRSVVEGVLALEDPHREIVIMRYYKELTTRNIAKQLGIPEATVRTRLHRGLQKLRSQLDSQYGDRREWMTRLLPLTVTAPTRTVVPMLAVLLLVCAGVGVSYWFGSDDGSQPESTVASTSDRAPESLSETSPAPAPASAVEEVSISSPAQARAAVVAIVLSQGSRVPVAGVEVACQYRDELALAIARRNLGAKPVKEPPLSTGASDGNTERVTAITDDHGLVRFALPPGVTRFDLRALAGTTQAASAWSTHYRPLKSAYDEPGANADESLVGDNAGNATAGNSTNETRKPIELIVGIGGTLEGQLVDTSGNPIGAGEVCVWHGDDLTNPPDRCVGASSDGYFTLDHLGDEFHILATAPRGWVTLQGLRGSLRDGQVGRDVVIVLAPAFVLEGYVRNAHGEALEGVEVVVPDGRSGSSSHDLTSVDGVARFSAGEGKGTTDGLGYFRIEGLPRREHYFVRGHARPYLAFRRNLERSEVPVEIIVDMGYTIRGRVVDTRGRGIPHADIYWGPHYPRIHSTPRKLRADEHGQFEIPGMDSAFEPWVAAAADGYASRWVDQVAEGADDLELRLPYSLRVQGRVVDRDGNPMSDIQVRLESTHLVDNDNLSRQSHPNTIEALMKRNIEKSHEDGSFVFSGLTEGEYQLYAYADARGSYSVSARVHLHHQDSRERSATPDRLDVELVLDENIYRGVILRGIVRDELTHLPVARFSVTPMIREASSGSSGSAVESFRGTRRNFHADPAVEDEASATGASEVGVFEVDGIPPGEVQVNVEASGYAQWQQTLVLERGTHELIVDLSPTRSLDVLVLDDKGKVLSNAELRIRDHTLESQPMVWFRVDRHSRSAILHLNGEVAHLHGLPARPLTIEVVFNLEVLGAFAIDMTEPRGSRDVGPLVLSLGDTTQTLGAAADSPQKRVVPLIVMKSHNGDAKSLWVDFRQAADLRKIGVPEPWTHQLSARLTDSNGNEIASWEWKPDESGFSLDTRSDAVRQNPSERKACAVELTVVPQTMTIHLEHGAESWGSYTVEADAFTSDGGWLLMLPAPLKEGSSGSTDH